MRDLLVALFVLGALPVSFKRPAAGMMTFSLLAYMRIQDLTWGFARGQRWSLYVALAMLAGWVFSRDKGKPIWTLRTALLLFMPVWMFFGLFEEIGAKAFQSANFIEYAKIIFISIFTTMVIQRREHLRALALAMSIPILVGLATSETNPYYRKWLRFCVPFSFLSVFATRSRGGFLSAGLATFILVWRSKNRIAGIMLMGCAGLAGLMALPKDMFERLQTLQNVSEDGSAMGRIRAWKVAGRMIEDQPFFGVGFNRFQANYLNYGDRVSERHDGTRVAHNAYLQIWSEGGTPVFLSYMALLLISVFSVQRLRRDALRLYDRSWILSYCTAFEGAFLTFMLGSAFLNRAHFDLIYHYFAIVMVFEVVARKEMENPLVSTGEARRGIGGRLTRFEGIGFKRSMGAGRGFRNTDLAPVSYRPARGQGGGAGSAIRETKRDA